MDDVNVDGWMRMGLRKRDAWRGVSLPQSWKRRKQFVVATVLVVSGCTGTSSTQSPGAVFIVKLGCMSDLGFGKCNFFRVEHINTAV